VTEVHTDSSVGYRPDVREIRVRFPDRADIFLLSTAFRPTLRLYIMGNAGIFCQVVKRLWHEAYHSSRYLPYRHVLMAWIVIKTILILVWCILFRLLSIRKRNTFVRNCICRIIYTTTCFGLHVKKTAVCNTNGSVTITY
jgi:hypothetical protein